MSPKQNSLKSKKNFHQPYKRKFYKKKVKNQTIQRKKIKKKKKKSLKQKEVSGTTYETRKKEWEKITNLQSQETKIDQTHQLGKKPKRKKKTRKRIKSEPNNYIGAF